MEKKGDQVPEVLITSVGAIAAVSSVFIFLLGLVGAINSFSDGNYIGSFLYIFILGIISVVILALLKRRPIIAILFALILLACICIILRIIFLRIS